jgi:hypothetical protein
MELLETALVITGVSGQSKVHTFECRVVSLATRRPGVYSVARIDHRDVALALELKGARMCTLCRDLDAAAREEFHYVTVRLGVDDALMAAELLRQVRDEGYGPATDLITMRVADELESAVRTRAGLRELADRVTTHLTKTGAIAE